MTDQLVLGKVKSETPQFPLLVYHAKADEIIPIEDVRTMVANWCRNGIKSLNFVCANDSAKEPIKGQTD